jgi:hypothetical protein
VSPQQVPIVKAVRDAVVALGAWCDLVPQNQSRNSPGSVSFLVCEFAVLANDAKVTLRNRGFAVSGPVPPTDMDPLAGMTVEEIESHARTAMMPDEVDSEDEHPYEFIQDLLRSRGIEASASSLRLVPYTFELSPRLRRIAGQRET